MMNMVVDAFKISQRATQLMIYNILKRGTKPKFVLL